MSGNEEQVNTPPKKNDFAFLTSYLSQESPPVKLRRSPHDMPYPGPIQKENASQKLIAESFAIDDDLQSYKLLEVIVPVEQQEQEKKEDPNFELLINLETTMQHMKEVARHEFTCLKKGKMELIQKRQTAMDTNLTFKCSKCKIVKICRTHTNEQAEQLNKGTVSGALSIGLGHGQAHVFLAHMGIRLMAFSTFAKNKECVLEQAQAE